MKFEEAIKAMREGKIVTRKHEWSKWGSGEYLRTWLMDNTRRGLIVMDKKGGKAYIDSDDMVAEDWMILVEGKEHTPPEGMDRPLGTLLNEATPEEETEEETPEEETDGASATEPTDEDWLEWDADRAKDCAAQSNEAKGTEEEGK